MHVLIITGGHSSEREISFISATNVKRAVEMNGHTVETFDFKEGYDELANFFRTRKMYSLIIPKDQFIREWSEGVENTQSGFITDESGKRREFFQRGCPVSEFTEIVDLIRTTARRTVPCAVYSIKSCHGDTYSVGVSRGRVTFVMFGAEILS